MTNGFSPNLLKLARQYRGFSQAKVADKSGLNQGHYSRVENGLLPDGPNSENAQRIATALSFPKAFFFQEYRLAGLPLSVHPMNRRKAAVGERVLKRVHAQLNLRLMHLKKFLDAVDMEPELPCPHIDVDEGGGPTEIARTIRRAWSIPSGPLTGLTDYCERAGIVVTWADLALGIDGVTMRARDLPPCIFLNQNATADRMRASLAHELGHVIMHRVPTDNIEVEANAFAGELLVPEREFRRACLGNRIGLQWLVRQKRYWQVSIAFLLYRVGVLDVKNKYQTEYLWKQISARGWRTREPRETDLPFERPSVFPELLRFHNEELEYGPDALSQLLCISSEDLKDLYGIGTRPRKLFVVK